MQSITEVTDALAPFSSATLRAELERRNAAAGAEFRRGIERTYRRTRLAGAVTSARRALDDAEAEFGRRTIALDGLVAQGMAVRAEDVHLAEIRVSQANSSRTAARDAMNEAKRALAAFDGQSS